MKHIVELNARYKMGHQHMTAPFGVIGRNIIRVEKVPEEIPEHMDGCLARVQLTTGENVYVTQPFEDVMKAWHDALEHSL